jgi:glutaconate CoA-transferase subunit B
LVAPIPRAYLFFERHDPRVFVVSVDFVSGDVPAGGGELLIVTPLAVLGIAAGARRVALQSRHPGVTFDEVQQATGFTLAREHNVTTPAPSAAELAAIARCAEARALA